MNAGFHRRQLFIALSMVLTLAVSAIIVGEALVPKKRFHGRLSELLPKESELDGWKVRVRRVEESIERERVVQDMLEFDDAVFVDYSRNSVRISIYVAYWSPGRVSSHWVASHTPDVCWVQQGWRCLFRGTRNLGLRTRHALLVEFRTFQLNEQVEHVIFCHLVGGRTETYDGRGPLPTRSRDFLDRLILLQWSRPDAEQFFVRISSNRPLEEFAETPPVHTLLHGLSSLYATVEP
jgi:hypothetical protein